MKTKTLVRFLGSIVLSTFMVSPCFSQSAGGCTVTSKDVNNVIIISCPDGTKSVNVGPGTDLYRVGDRVDIYGMPSNQPTSRPGETTFPGR